ncbi:MAG: zinc finger domain-containing protein [Poseidonia sp.]
MLRVAHATIKRGRPWATLQGAIPMSERAKVCTSSGIPLAEEGSTTFPCPGCFHPIGRSPRVRNQGVLYKCPNCGFVGP